MLDEHQCEGILSQILPSVGIQRHSMALSILEYNAAKDILIHAQTASVYIVVADVGRHVYAQYNSHLMPKLETQ